MATNTWWADRISEKYWLEVTGRADIGSDLRAPNADDSGRENWRYSLFTYCREGEIVFHYDATARAIVGASTVSGVSAPIVIHWGARGSYARDKGTSDGRDRPGYSIPIDSFTSLENPIQLEDIRQHEFEIRAIQAELADVTKGALYLPFELSEKRPMRLLQGYAFKLPAAVVDLFPDMQKAVAQLRDGQAYAEPSLQHANFDAAESGLPNATAEEGRSSLRTHFVRERDQRITKMKKAAVIAKTGDLACEACAFSFRKFYGDAGDGFIECHHRVPLGTVEMVTQTSLNDLALLCANCHRMIHRLNPMPTVDELRHLILSSAQLRDA